MDNTQSGPAFTTEFNVQERMLYKARLASDQHALSTEKLSVPPEVKCDTSKGKPDNVYHKCFIADTTQKAIMSGVTQVVNLGGSCDDTIKRLCEKHRRVTFIEVAHPLVRTYKKSRVFKKQPDINVLETSFNKTLQACSKFSPEKTTLFIFEGVLMHLELPAVITLFKSLRAFSGAGTKFVFGGVKPENKSSCSTNGLLKIGGLLKCFSTFKKHPALWTLSKEHLAGFLECHNFELNEVADTEVLKSRYTSSKLFATPNKKEYMVVAEVQADNG